MKNVLVLGGTGAMGGYLVDILNSTNEYCIDVTSRTYHPSRGNVSYIQGNARSNDFLSQILKPYDVIVDFMNYDYDEMATRIIKLLSSAGQYIWFSSCRVYSNSDMPLCESSPRLLETTTDKVFLTTNRYALRKARQEEMIISSGFKNFTIIRPYITYSNTRFQLGVYEKEQWLYRILKGRDLVINKGIIDKITTLTFGYDVALAVSKCLNNDSALAKTIQIVSNETMSWSEVLSLYLSIIKDKKGISPNVYVCDTMDAIDELYEGGYNTIYDRFYNRIFDSSLIESVIGEKIEYKEIRSGLSRCLSSFIANNHPFLSIDWKYEAYQDFLLDQYTPSFEIPTAKERDLYETFRHVDLSQISRLEQNLDKLDIC